MQHPQPQPPEDGPFGPLDRVTLGLGVFAVLLFAAWGAFFWLSSHNCLAEAL